MSRATVAPALPASASTVCFLVVTMMFWGCGSQGQQRYELSGQITFGGKPVPAGYLIFTPDASQSNPGPGAQADIQNGKYHLAPERGTVGGPHIVTITGCDGKPINTGGVVNPYGKPLFAARRVNVDLSKEPATHDFHLPDTK